MNLRLHPYTLNLRRTFTLATSSRTATPALFVELEHEGITGFGEASMVPYRDETPETAAKFLSSIDTSRFRNPLQIEEILQDVDLLASGNTAAKAAFDIALHDWVGKKQGKPWYAIWGLDLASIPATSFTIGIGAREEVRTQAAAAAEFKVLKVKLGRDNDREMIETIREVTDTTIRVDVNGGWSDRENALTTIEWLATRKVELVEQPMPKERVVDIAWLREKSPLPLIADEAVSRLSDLSAARGVYDGVNIKLMKCTGMREARAMIAKARGLNLKVMIGCMTESSCAISAAAQLSPLADWADLDGALLVSNDPFDGARLIDGKIIPAERPGIGAERVGSSFPKNSRCKSLRRIR
jgi:L-alanine-DL-glutamate epimerase-like enolase superfamily enzyme